MSLISAPFTSTKAAGPFKNLCRYVLALLIQVQLTLSTGPMWKFYKSSSVAMGTVKASPVPGQVTTVSGPLEAETRRVLFCVCDDRVSG